MKRVYCIRLAFVAATCVSLSAVLSAQDATDVPNTGPNTGPDAAQAALQLVRGSLVGPRGSADSQTVQLNEQFRLLENQSRDLALQAQRVDDENQQRELEAKLRAVVARAFDLRQQIQQREVQRLRDRLKNVESSLSKRTNLKSKIIERRVHNLLQKDGELQWDALQTQSLRSPALTPPRPSIFGAVGQSNPVRNLPSEPRATSRAPTGGSSAYGYSPLRTLFRAKAEHSKAEQSFRHSERMAAKGYHSVQSVEASKHALERARMDLAVAEKEYETQIALLKLEVRRAKLNLDAAATEYDRVRALRQRNGGVITVQDVQTKKLAVERAKLDLQKAETTLNLYLRSTDETNPKAADENKRSP